MEKQRFLSLDEIRLRENRPLAATGGEKVLFISPDGCFCSRESALTVSDADITDCLRRITERSRFSFDGAVKQGYIPFGNGMRAGVCGEALMRGESVVTISRITSINLRICRRVDAFALPLAEKYAVNGIDGTLICAPPAMGKTTFLRSIIYLLSSGVGIAKRRVGVADCRGELMSEGLSLLDCDVMSGCPKGYALEVLTRVMNPEVIICDELSAAEESAILEAANCGVPVIASVHAANVKEALSRPFVGRLCAAGVFKTTVTLARRNGNFYCDIGEVDRP